MALTLSNSISGQFDPSESSGFFVYALRRDADDMLLFSKVSAASTELGEFYRNDGTAIPAVSYTHLTLPTKRSV